MKYLYKWEKLQGTRSCINKFWMYYKSYANRSDTNSALLGQSS